MLRLFPKLEIETWRENMSRTVQLSLNEKEVIARCLKENVGVSAIESLPSGGVRLVCMSSNGAERIRTIFRTKLIEGEVARQPHRPKGAFW